MSEASFKLKNAPIVEAVLDFDCDMPPGFDLSSLEKGARDCFRNEYPKFQTQFVQEHKFEPAEDGPAKVSVRRGVQAFRFVHNDDKQLVQIRTEGYSFNRLAPYTSLDDYLPEIERTWSLFLDLVKPVQIRRIALRYINRILLPIADGKLDLDNFLRVAPKLPMEDQLIFTGFLNQHVVEERKTGNLVNITLASQPPENDKLPIIFDISATNGKANEPREWTPIMLKINSLRDLKNHVFRNSLTERCLNLFQ